MTLATKIAVLKDGELQQVGTPHEIYNRPANLFVADFMGSPSMNLMEASVVSDDGRTVLSADPRRRRPTSALPVPRPSQAGAARQGRKVILGIRPEAITDQRRRGPPFQLPSRSSIRMVEVVEPAGADTFVVTHLAGKEVTARMRADADVQGRHDACPSPSTWTRRCCSTRHGAAALGQFDRCHPRRAAGAGKGIQTSARGLLASPSRRFAPPGMTARGVSSVQDSRMPHSSPDVLIIGSGIGGATLAAGLAGSGAKVVILERGEQLPGRARRRATRAAIFMEGRYRPNETWLDAARRAPSTPATTTMSAAIRSSTARSCCATASGISRRSSTPTGVTPAWPISYAELEPWYTRAEQLFQVRGATGEDPTEPPRSAPVPVSAGARTSRPSPAPGSV